jgi:hypothetical protein
MQNTDLQLVQPSLDLEICIDAESCSRELNRCAAEADRCAALAQAGAELAVRHAWNAGAVCLKAKEILPHGEFGPWLEENSKERGIATMYKWMKLAKFQLNVILGGNPKGLNDAYKLTGGILPEPEPKPETQEGDKERPPFTLAFKCIYKHPSEWSRDAARDFLYEFDRIARTAMQLKTEFGL